MSTLTTSWVRVDSLHTAHQIRYDNTVMEVLPVEVTGGWSVIAVAVLDRGNPPLRKVLLFSTRSAVAELVTRVLSGEL